MPAWPVMMEYPNDSNPVDEWQRLLVPIDNNRPQRARGALLALFRIIHLAQTQAYSLLLRPNRILHRRFKAVTVTSHALTTPPIIFHALVICSPMISEQISLKMYLSKRAERHAEATTAFSQQAPPQGSRLRRRAGPNSNRNQHSHPLHGAGSARSNLTLPQVRRHASPQSQACPSERGRQQQRGLCGPRAAEKGPA